MIVLPDGLLQQIDETWRVVAKYYGDIVRISECGPTDSEIDRDIIRMIAGVVMLELNRKNCRGEL